MQLLLVNIIDISRLSGYVIIENKLITKTTKKSWLYWYLIIYFTGSGVVLMIGALQVIAERKIDEFFRKDGGPDLSHWRNKPLPVEDMSNVPADLRMGYKILKNAGYVPEEVALQKEIARTEDLLAHCHDEKEKLKQLKKLSFLQFKLECKMGRRLQFESDSPYFDRIVDKITVHSS